MIQFTSHAIKFEIKKFIQTKQINTEIKIIVRN